ncbi:hypothetical protein F503_00139 [Ophiostoma piceae UAMH 11346]|uniref:JmjC domain-containing protein n=1 Tax=Ophiostoma piceae (strain UAMH 11346) TaxID=1262450 RepID=S3CW10_OPHP1|nr:hypothetical protein F503_00139 [Ophiostoma piceae UAMH 11346]
MKCSSHTVPRCARLRSTGALARPWRQFYSTASAATARPVQTISSSELSLDAFRERAFRVEKPVLIQGGDTGSDSSSVPAATRWFEFGAGARGNDGSLPARLSDYLQENFAMASLPYELMLPPRNEGHALDEFIAWLTRGASDTSSSSIQPALAELLSHQIAMEGGSRESESRLVRLEAPFALFMAAVEFNHGRRASSPLTQLYIAQASLSDLPLALREDVPPPELVQKAGRGDVYASSVWLGLEPTYTPWHRDPNPNLFVQLCSRKTVRVMAPKAGERIFRSVQTELMKRTEGAGSSSSRIRGEEMMQGPERQLLHEAVWSTAAASSESTLQEAHLEPGDMLFIPKGWWHSVKSVYADGRLNGSVNWWFR